MSVGAAEASADPEPPLDPALSRPTDDGSQPRDIPPEGSDWFVSHVEEILQQEVEMGERQPEVERESDNKRSKWTPTGPKRNVLPHIPPMSDRPVANGATRFHKPPVHFRLYRWSGRHAQLMSSLEAERTYKAPPTFVTPGNASFGLYNPNGWTSLIWFTLSSRRRFQARIGGHSDGILEREGQHQLGFLPRPHRVVKSWLTSITKGSTSQASYQGLIES